jgi:hypothetical protein
METKSKLEPHLNNTTLQDSYSISLTIKNIEIILVLSMNANRKSRLTEKVGK